MPIPDDAGYDEDALTFLRQVETDGIEIYQTQVRFADVLRHLRRLDELCRKWAPDYGESDDARQTRLLLDFNADFDGPTDGDDELDQPAGGGQ